MNSVLSERPQIGDDYFIFSQPTWVNKFFRLGWLVIAALLANLVWLTNGLSLPISDLLWAACALLALAALRPTTNETAIYFVCNHQGIYFPSVNTQSLLGRVKDRRWLHVPWHNVSDVKIQLLLDESANTKGIAFSILATESEGHDFLTWHTMHKNPEVPKTDSMQSFRVGFSSVFHRHDRVIATLLRFQSRPLTKDSTTERTGLLETRS